MPPPRSTPLLCGAATCEEGISAEKVQVKGIYWFKTFIPSPSPGVGFVPVTSFLFNPAIAGDRVLSFASAGGAHCATSGRAGPREGGEKLLPVGERQGQSVCSRGHLKPKSEMARKAETHLAFYTRCQTKNTLRLIHKNFRPATGVKAPSVIRLDCNFCLCFSCKTPAGKHLQ